MSKDQTEAESERANDPQQPRRSGLAGLRAQPGFRTAVIAFVLTVVLGIGGTAAYAYWSKSVPVSITGTTRSDLPVGTGVVSAQPALQARPGTPSDLKCQTVDTHDQMKTKVVTDIRFSWQKVAAATGYVITVRSNSTGYVYEQTKTVTAESTVFQFKRWLSDDWGNPEPGPTPFYTKYTVRVMPMNGDIPGDPLYWTLEYAHQNSANCYKEWIATGASPLGSAGPVQCASISGPGAGKYTDLGVKWARADKATSYSVRLLSPGGYGSEVTVTDTKAAFRVMRPAPESDTAPYFATYTVRVQPMQGTVAGDPVYLREYQFYTWKNSC